MSDLKTQAEQIGASARKAGLQLASIDGKTRTAALHKIAAAIRNRTEQILAANTKDLDHARQTSLAHALLERLKTEKGTSRDVPFSDSRDPWR